MKNKRYGFLISLILLISNLVYAYDYLRVEDVQGSRRSYQGTIEEAVVSIRPRGVYTEIGLYLTFSARNYESRFSGNAQLEVQFYFDLPKDAIMHDSWLWVGEDIVRADILDKWTASRIYEDIVRRRRDPSILFKRGNGQYELRIFPMLPSETRKVKLTYLVPAQWTTNAVLSGLPTNLFRTSRNPLSQFHIIAWLENEWKNPSIVEFPDVPFVAKSDADLGDYLQADIPAEAIQTAVNFRVDSPLKNGVYVNKYLDKGEGYYQLAFLPSAAINAEASQRVAVLLDYNGSNSTTSKTDVLSKVKSLLHSTLTDHDSFNLFFSGLSVKRIGDTWLAADSLTIEQTFAEVGTNTFSSYSNMPSLIANGIDFVKNEGDDGSILLIANSDNVGDYNPANDLIDDLMALMENKIPITIADFQQYNYTYHYFGGRQYRGNEYFYMNISRLTSGNYFSVLAGNSFNELVNSAFGSIGGYLSAFDLHTNIQNGFCFARFNLNSTNQTTYINRPILQVGKFNGSFPFEIDLSGIFNDAVFSQKITVAEDQIFSADSLNKEMWVGQQINFLEGQYQSNDVVSEIVNYSLEERVLSIYTAFLALEPSDEVPICNECLDETELLTSVSDLTEEATVDTLIAQAYPNPFNAQTNIRIHLAENTDYSKLSFKIFNIKGQHVRTFRANPTSDARSLNFTWNGTNDNGQMVASGNYYFVATTPTGRHSVKLMMLK